MIDSVLIHLTNGTQRKLLEDYIKKIGALVADGTEVEFKRSEYNAELSRKYRTNALKERLVSATVMVDRFWGMDLEAMQRSSYEDGHFYIEWLYYYCDGEIIEEIDYEDELEQLEKYKLIQTEETIYSSVEFNRNYARKFKL